MFLFGTFSLPMVIIEVQPKTSNYLTPTYLIPEKVMLFVVHSEEHFYCKYQWNMSGGSGGGNHIYIFIYVYICIYIYTHICIYHSVKQVLMQHSVFWLPYCSMILIMIVNRRKQTRLLHLVTSIVHHFKISPVSNKTVIKIITRSSRWSLNALI